MNCDDRLFHRCPGAPVRERQPFRLPARHPTVERSKLGNCVDFRPKLGMLSPEGVECSLSRELTFPFRKKTEDDNRLTDRVDLGKREQKVVVE